MAETFDIYIVGVGGQGVLTIADILTQAAFQKGIPVNDYPTKGMAQRGGFVKVQLRIGSAEVGPDISVGGADLVISMEQSEALKGIRYLKKDGEFFLYTSRWNPADVMLGKAPYPGEEVVVREIKKAGGKALVLDPASRPEYAGRPVRDNIYVLGALFGQTELKRLFAEDEIRQLLKDRWPKAAEVNAFAFDAGVNASVKTV